MNGGRSSFGSSGTWRDSMEHGTAMARSISGRLVPCHEQGRTLRSDFQWRSIPESCLIQTSATVRDGLGSSIMVVPAACFITVRKRLGSARS